MQAIVHKLIYSINQSKNIFRELQTSLSRLDTGKELGGASTVVRQWRPRNNYTRVSASIFYMWQLSQATHYYSTFDRVHYTIAAPILQYYSNIPFTITKTSVSSQFLCWFYNQRRWSMAVTEYSIEEAWGTATFHQVRAHFVQWRAHQTAMHFTFRSSQLLVCCMLSGLRQCDMPNY